MRHVVNFGLLLSFLTLAVTGGLAFWQPFSIVTTRVHILFGTATAVLVALHLVSRIKYFRNQLRLGRRSNLSPLLLSGIVGGWAALLATAYYGWRPAQVVIEQGYEARHRAEIVRPSPLVGFEDLAGHRRLVVRSRGEDADASLSLYIGFGQEVDPLPAVAVWAETETGTMIETLYLDPALAYSETADWGGRPTPRHKILPLWRHRYTAVSGVDPSGKVDAVTAATPTHSFTLDDYLQLGEPKTFILCVEVNAPGDPNEAYGDEHFGQPSLLYTAYIDLQARQRYALLELTGHGGGTAETSGAIQYDLEKFTSAKKLVELLLAKAQPVKKSQSK